MNVQVNAFVNGTSVINLEREKLYTAIIVKGETYGSHVVLFFDTEETLQRFISVISANKEDTDSDS